MSSLRHEQQPYSSSKLSDEYDIKSEHRRARVGFLEVTETLMLMAALTRKVFPFLSLFDGVD